MPQPMSTPTAAGATAWLIAMTEPTVAPLPRWTSGMTRTPTTHGSDAMLRNCWRAAESISCSWAHIFTSAWVPGSVVGNACIGPG